RASDASTVRIGRPTRAATRSATPDQGHERRGPGKIIPTTPDARVKERLAVPGAVRELRRRRLELAGRGHVDVVHLERAPLDQERGRWHLRIGGEFEARLGPGRLRLGRREELEELDGLRPV